MRDLAMVIKTRDRRPVGQPNYLGATLHHLARSGLWESSVLHSLQIVDSGSPDPREYIATEVTPYVPSGLSSHRLLIDLGVTGLARTLHQTAALAIRRGAATGAPWMLVLDDDIDVCDQFADAVVAWLEDHATPAQVLYAFGANFPHIQRCVLKGGTLWPYPVGALYGAQALAWSHDDAMQLADWLGPDPSHEPSLDPAGDGVRNWHHLLIGWGRSRDVTHFAASAPSFVDHVGVGSGLNNKFFRFASWLGPGWRYYPRSNRAISLDLFNQEVEAAQ